MNTREKAEYLIVQYLREPFRKEARNVGVIVLKDGRSASRFIGETESGSLDGKKLRWMPHPTIYRQWVDSWKEELLESSDTSLKDRLMEGNGGNYNVIVGGAVTDSGEDSPEQICHFLFNSLVGTKSVFAAEDETETPVQQFKQQITKEFRQVGILKDATGDGVRHPIWADTIIHGKTIEHVPSYFQQNGKLWVMEPVNYSLQSRQRVRDHAYYAAKMFDDIRAKYKSKSSAIAIVQGTPEDLQDKVAENTIKLLEASSESPIVYWDNEESRTNFIAERQRIAVEPPPPPRPRQRRAG